MKFWTEIQRDVGVIAEYASKKEVQKAILDRAVSFVLKDKRDHSSVVAASLRWKWFQLQGFVNDSRASKVLCRIQAGNAELGNRYKDRYRCSHVSCPWSLSMGIQAWLVESHVVLACLCVAAQCRFFFGVSVYHTDFVNGGNQLQWPILDYQCRWGFLLIKPISIQSINNKLIYFLIVSNWGGTEKDYPGWLLECSWMVA